MARIPYSAGSGSNFQPLPEGTYDLRINETIQGTSKNDNPQLQLKLEVMDGPHAGKNVSCWYSLLPQSGWKLDLLLEALKIERDDTGQVDGDGNAILEFDDEWLLNRVVQFDVKQREWNGKINNDFTNERMSSLDPESGAQAAAPTPQGDDAGATQPGTNGGGVQEPAKAPAVQQPTGNVQPAAAPGQMRRRPRPQG